MGARLFAVAVLLAGGVLSISAQHAETAHDAAGPAGTASHPAPTTQHAPAQASPTPTSKPPSSKTTASPTDMRAVVERIQRRIDEELPAVPAGPAIAKPTRPSATPAATPNTRVHLVWRVSLVWPDELMEQP